jgi:hypothetical protein
MMLVDTTGRAAGAAAGGAGGTTIVTGGWLGGAAGRVLDGGVARGSIGRPKNDPPGRVIDEGAAAGAVAVGATTAIGAAANADWDRQAGTVTATIATAASNALIATRRDVRADQPTKRRWQATSVVSRSDP